jgi:hypothetical protein
MDDNKWVIDGGDPKEEGEYYVRYRKTKLVDIGWESIDVSEYTTYKNGMWGFSVEPETTSVKILAWQKCNPKSIDKEMNMDDNKWVTDGSAPKEAGAYIARYRRDYIGKSGWEYEYHIEPLNYSCGMWDIKTFSGDKITIEEWAPMKSKSNENTVDNSKIEGRKIIQIAASSNNGHVFAHALCNDGTVWYIYGGSKTWVREPAIPQDNEKEKAL